MITLEKGGRTAIRHQPALQPPGLPANHVRVGFGTGPGHHGEIVQGMFEIASGRPAHGLVTLPCPLFRSRVRFTPNGGHAITAFGLTRAEGSPYAKAIAAAELTCRSIGIAGRGGDLRLDSNIPAGKGCGSSTADVVGAIRAVADSAGVWLSPSGIGRLAVESELASDAPEGLPQPATGQVPTGCQTVLVSR
jgi:uncharacterized protein involved in propanediol utilization